MRNLAVPARQFAEIVMHAPGRYTYAEVLHIYINKRKRFFSSPEKLVQEMEKAEPILTSLFTLKSGVLVEFEGKIYLGPTCLECPSIIKQLSAEEIKQIFNYQTFVYVAGKFGALGREVILQDRPSFGIYPALPNN